MARQGQTKAQARNFKTLQASHDKTLREDLERQKVLVETLVARKVAEIAGSKSATNGRVHAKKVGSP